MASSPSRGPEADPETEPPHPSGEPGTVPVVPAVLRVVLYLIFVIILLALGMQAALPIVAPDVAEGIKAAAKSESIDPNLKLGLGRALAIQALMLPLVLLGTAFFVRRVDRRPLPWIGVSLPPGAARASMIASALAGLAPAIWLGLVAIAGDVRVLGLASGEGAMPMGRLVLFLGGFVVAALSEEIMLRGYVFTTLGERYGFVNAAGASAAIFAVLHGGNPAVGPVAMINTFLLGLLFGALRFKSGSILPCVAAHALWNLVVACVFSLPLSGIASSHVIAVEVGGSVYATGGDYGPEASLLLTGMLVPLVFLSVLWAVGPIVDDEDADATSDDA